MKIKDIYQLVVDKGMERDPRGREKVEEILEKNKKKFEEMDEKKKNEFDQESLVNPYDDTRILWGDAQAEAKKVLVGIDMGGEELLLLDRLREKGKEFDLAISHHPQGRALAGLHGVMRLQEDVLHSLGVPINVAEGLMEPRISEVERNLLPLNHYRSVDMARMLDIPYMCVHTPSDNMVVKFLTDYFEDKNPDTVGEVIEALKDIPEYKKAVELNTGPKCLIGSEERRAGKIFVDMTGGTGGSEDAYSKLAEAGVGTIVGMHMGEKHRKNAKKNHINVVIAGHMASDSLGLNLLVDMLQQKDVEVNHCSGFIRHSRI